MDITNNQLDILEHTAYRTTGGFYCGDSSDMQTLVKSGFMVSVGGKSFVLDEYFKLTNTGRQAMAEARKEKDNG